MCWSGSDFNGCYYQLRCPKRIAIVFAVMVSLATYLYLLSDTSLLRSVESVVDPQNWTLPLGGESMFRNEVHYARKTEFQRRIQGKGCA